MQDEKIIELYWERNESAIRETQTVYEKYLSKIIYNVLGNLQDSTECLNDTYFRIWNSIPPNRPAVFSTYIGKIARETAIDAYRKQNRSKRKASEYTLALDEISECVSGRENTEKAVEAKILGKEISSYLRTVSEDKRTVFIMRYYYADSVKDISKHMNMSESRVKSILHRMRKGLKKHLEKEGFEI